MSKKLISKLTVEEAWNTLPVGLGTNDAYVSLGKNDQRRLDPWFEEIRYSIAAEIAAERDAEIADLRFRLDEARQGISKVSNDRHELSVALTVKDAEIARLQAELDRQKPKPRKTAGEKLTELLKSYGVLFFEWNHLVPEERKRLDDAAAATESPLLIDDPEPPSDGELFERACLHTRRDGGKAITHDWSESAAKFLRLRAERDGETT